MKLLRWAKIYQEWTIIEEIDDNTFYILGNEMEFDKSFTGLQELGDYVKIPKKYKNSFPKTKFKI